MTYRKATLFITFFSLIVGQYTFGQNRKLSDEELNHSTASKIRWADTITCAQIDKWVKSDIKSKTIFLFLTGGIAPAVYTTDQKFEDKYGIYYFDFGDSSPDYKCVIKYNDMVFDYLTKVYGKKWKREVRKDIIGLSEWKKQNRKIRN